MLKWHRRARKSTLCLNMLIMEALTHPSSVYGYIGPTYKQAKAIAWQDPNMLFAALPSQEECRWEKNESELYVKFPNDSRIVIKGADDPDSLRGLDFAGAAFDEWAEQKPEIWYEIILPVIRQRADRWAIFAYTPKGENHASEMWRAAEGQPDWYRSVLRASESGLIPPVELAAARREMPVSVYEQEYECADITDEEMVLISSRMLDNLRGIHHIGIPQVCYVACDPALDAGDECPAYAWKGRDIVDDLFQRERDTTKIAANLVAFCLRNDAEHLIVDAGGLGKGVADDSAKLADGRINVIQYVGPAKANDPKYRNQRTEAWFEAAKLVADKEVPYPEDLEMRRQICSVRYMPADYADIMRLEPKPRTKARLGCSPDRADAWVLGVSAGTRLLAAAEFSFCDKYEDEEFETVSPWAM
jgi:phage terminase large subunit-like protein